MSTARNLYRALWGGTDAEPSAAKRVLIDPPSKVTGMGRLQWLEIARHGRVEQWHFEANEPRLCFGRLTDTDRGRSTLWILGGSYKISGRGFRLVGKAKRLSSLDLARATKASPEIVDRYARTHGGRDPIEALLASLSVPDELVPIGDLYAVTYDADKGDGTYPYRHPFALTARPLVCCDPSGTQLFVVGGRYTVTPHGIEDAA